MDYVNPSELANTMIEVGAAKSRLPARDLLIRSALAGGLLAICTSLAITTTSQTGVPVNGAIIFPIGFVIIVLLGLELLTGSFALLPVAALAGRANWRDVFRNWAWVYAGNMLGSVFYALLFWVTMTNCGATPAAGIAPKLVALAEAKTLGYAALGDAGMATAFIKGVLCNWMVCIGVVMGMASRSTLGKVLAAWLPVTVFFAQGFEHAVVNMFVIPVGIMLGAKVSLAYWLLWNQLPVTLGNLLGGFGLTGVAIYITYGRSSELARSTESGQASRIAEAT